MKRLEEYLEKTNTKFISIDPSDKRRIIVESKYGQHSVLIGLLSKCSPPTAETAIDKRLFFEKKSREVHGDRYEYSKSNYTTSGTNVTITCKIHGDFSQIPSGHLSGSGCPICNPFDNPITQESFVSRLKEINPNLKVLSESNGNRSYVIVSDLDGIKYNCNVATLLKGCVPSIETAVDKDSAYEFKARQIHGNKYSYKDCGYIKNALKVSIECPIHGVFLQKAGNHLIGHGCPKCADKIVKDYNKENPVGWSLSSWIKRAETSEWFDSYKVYIIRCVSENEEFIKIGRTFSTLKRRYCNWERLPYDYTIIKEICDNPHRVFKLEAKLKRICKSERYMPTEKFKGMHECFNVNCLNLIKEYIDDNA